MASRNISVRLSVDGGAEAKAALEGFGKAAAALDPQLRSSLEALSTGGDAAGRLASQLGGAAAAINAAQKQLAAANSSGDTAGQVAAQQQLSKATEAYNGLLERKRAQLVPTAAAAQTLAKSLADVDSAEKLGAVSTAEATAARTRAQATYAATTASLKEITNTSGAAAASMRGLGIQFVQGISGIATGQPILTTFIQQGHQVVDQSLAMGVGFKGVSDAAKGLFNAVGGFSTVIGVGVVGSLALAGVAANQNANRLADLRQALRLTHDDYASLADTVDASAKRVASSSLLTRTAAEDIGKAISSSRYLGEFRGDLDNLTKSAADYARVAGVDGVQAGKLFRQAIDEPAAAAKVLSDQGLPAMDAALLRTVQNLANSGRAGDATRLVFEALRKGTQGAAQDASPLGKALHDLEQRLYGARDGGKSLADTVGSLVNDFVALQVRGLDKLIEGLDKFIGKVQSAKSANVGNTATLTGGGGVDDFGRPYSTENPLNPATRAGAGTVGGSLGQVDASIRPLVDAAAKQYQVDSELLARLQLAENRTPSGYDAAGNAIFPRSPTGPVGAMQVAPTTFAGLPGFAGQNINDNATNINAGTSLFATLLKKYGDPYIAVLAYHDGETLIDKVLSGARDASGNLYGYSIEGVQEATRVTAGYSGKGLVTASASNAAIALPTIDVKAGGASSALPESVQRLLGTGNDGTQFTDAQDASNKIGEITRAIIDLRGAGQTAGPEMDRLQALLGKARAAAEGAITPFEGVTRAAQDQIGPLQAQSGAARTVAEAISQATIALRARGQDITGAQADQVRTDALKKLALAFNDVVVSADLATASNQRVAGTLDQGAASFLQATNRERALAQAREDFLPGPEQDAAVDRYTQALNRQSASVADLASVQKSFDQRDQLAILQLETASLGQNADLRDKEIALLQAKQALIKQGADLDSVASKASLANVAAISDATAALKQQQASLNELSSFFDNTFNTISDAIVSAFATGEQSAVKFKDVVASVEKAIEAEFLKLALLNPLKNFLFGTSTSSSPTLFSVGGVLGQLLGNSGSSSSGTSTSIFDGAGITIDAVGSSVPSTGSSGLGLSDIAGAAGTLGTIAKGFDWLTGGHLVSDLSSGIKSGISNISSTSLFTSGGTDAVSTAGATSGLTVPEGAVDGFTSAGGSTSAGVNVTLGSAVGIVGGLYGAYSGFERGGIGGTVQGIGGVASAGVAAAGAGLLGSGAAGLAAAAGPYAIAALAAIAIIGALLPGAHPLHSYQDTQVDVQDGHLVSSKTVSQVQNTAAAVQSVSDYSASLDQFLATAGLKLTNLDGVIGHLGQGIEGLTQVDNVDALFSKLQFGGDPSDTSNFGVAKGALAGMSFQNFGDLGAELTKIAGFADAASAIGLKLQAVGTDLTNIQIASVAQNATPATTTVRDGQGNDVTFNSDLRQALNADLPGKTFASVGALDAEIGNVTTFITQTLPQLLTPTKVTSSSLQQQIDAAFVPYAQASQRDAQLGLDNHQAIEDAWGKALAIIMKPAIDAVTTTLTSIQGRGSALLYGQASGAAGGASLANLSQSQAAERAQLEDQWRQTWGDGVIASGAYNSALQTLIDTQNAETQATLLQATTTRDQSVATLTSLQASYAQRAGITDLGTQLAAQDAKAAVERDQFYAAWIDTYGQLSTASQAFQDELVVVDKAHAAERLEIQKAYVGQSAAQLKQAQGSVASLFTSLKDYAFKLQTGDSSPLSPTAQYDLASSQFNAVSGAALAGDANSASQLTNYADALISASRGVNGSGAAYDADYNRVLDVLQGVTGSVDALTNSFVGQALKDQTAALQDSISSLQDEVRALRREVQLGRALQAQAA